MPSPVAPSPKSDSQIEDLQRQIEELQAQLACAEHKMHERNEHFKALFQHSHDAVLVVEPTRNKVIDANDKACDMLGYTRDELCCMPMSAIHGGDNDHLKSFAGAVMEHGHGFTDRLHCRTKTGLSIDAEVSASMLHKCGDRARFLVSIRNVTERRKVESALETSETLFQAVFETAPMAIAIADPHGNLQEVNRSFVSLFGYTQDDVDAGMHFKDLASASKFPDKFAGQFDSQDLGKHPGISNDGRQAMQDLLEGRRDSYQIEKTFQRKDGHQLLGFSTVFVLRDKHGQVRNIIALIKDITEYYQMLGNLRASEERYKTISRMTSDYVYRAVITERGTMVTEWATDGLRALTGYEADELERAGGWPDIVHGDDRASWQEWRERLLSSGESGALEYRILSRDRETRWVRDHWNVVWDEREQRTVSVLAATSDITIHRQADIERERLLTELRRQTAIIENTSDFVGMANMCGQLVYVNPAGMAMVGRNDQACTELLITCILDKQSGRILKTEVIPHLLEHDGVWEGELMLRHRGGHVIPTTVAITVVRNEDGEPYAIGAIARDVTDVKRFERALEEARDKAETANRAKSAFLASMSHELRTPLNAILGFSQLMSRDRGLTREQQDNLTIINRSGEHLLALINDVLEMSKIEAGRTTVNPTDFALHQLLSDMEDMFRLRAAGKNLSLLFERDASVPVYAHGDEGKLRQILINLISNAIKFTDEGGVTVRIGYQDKGDSSDPRPRLMFEVEDTGVGIDNDEIDQLFEAFVQTRSGVRTQEGTGLGIPISREFARMLGGELTVKSQVGVGSTFYFHVRITGADACASTVVKDVRKVVGLQPDQDKFRILVVEDRVENRRLLTRLLRPLGFDVREAVNGQEAVDMWEEFDPHLIWMDMRMPVMDGYEATVHIRATERGKDMVIIAITASAFEEDRTMILSAGCDDFVRKPFREIEIYDKMTEHLGVQFLYDELADEDTGAASGAGELAVDAMPQPLRASLEQATLEADFDSMFAVIEEMRDHDERTATALAEMANGFRYDEILGLLAAVDVAGAVSAESTAIQS